MRSLFAPSLRARAFSTSGSNKSPCERCEKPVGELRAIVIFDSKGEMTYRCSWVTDIPLEAHNVEKVVRAARARWKIENEGFNTLKNQGYHLEHNFGHGSSLIRNAVPPETPGIPCSSDPGVG